MQFVFYCFFYKGLNMAMEGSNTSISDEHLRELQRIMSSHKICGFPLHFSFGDIGKKHILKSNLSKKSLN